MNSVLKIKLFDGMFLLLFPLLALIISVQYDVSYFFSILLFYGIPGIYLAARYGRGHQSSAAFIFAILTSIPFVIVVDYIGVRSGLWYVPNTVFPNRLLGVIPWEDFLWMLSAIYTIVMMYEITFDKGRKALVSSRMRYFIFPAMLIVLVFLFIISSGSEQIFHWGGKYSYLVLGVLFFLFPTVLILSRFPGLLRKSLPLVIYFFYLTLLFEIAAMLLNQWIFTGSYFFAPLRLFGGPHILWEELFFVGIIGPLAAITFYEFFNVDSKDERHSI